MTPSELEQCGWLQRINGVVINAGDGLPSCTGGNARVLDFSSLPAPPPSSSMDCVLGLSLGCHGARMAACLLPFPLTRAS